MFAILAALEQIDVQAAMGKLPDVLEYKIDPLRLQDALPEDRNFESTFALADLFAEGLADPDLLLVERINSLIVESKAEIEAYIAEYHDLYQDDPPAFADEIAGAAELIPEPVDVAEAKTDPVELPGLETGPVKAMDWSLDMDDKGTLHVDTDGMLPVTKIDLRDGVYESDSATLQKALDAVAVVDQAASPIRTGIVEGTYNNAVEVVRNVGQQ